MKIQELYPLIEQAALHAWPALHELDSDGWVMRFSDGYTKRANSVNSLGHSTLEVQEKIGRCEQLYASRGLPCIFRLTPFSSPPGLDQALEERGYTVLDPSLVLHVDLSGRTFDLAAGLELSTHPLDDWLHLFCQLSGKPLAEHHTHRAMLALRPPGVGQPFERLFASLGRPDGAETCAVGVLEGSCFGLFDLVTAPQHRNQGWGTALVSAMLRWAQERGASHAYLQVVQHNAPARRLYAKVGFEEAYPYWYRSPGYNSPPFFRTCCKASRSRSARSSNGDRTGPP
jgi:GNAT superfamily N-acetyltransferase